MGSVDVDTIDHVLEESNLGILEATLEKYDAERDKRLRPDGLDQYIFLDRTKDPEMRAFTDDPWLNERSDEVTIEDGQTIQHLVLGAGMGGLGAGISFVKTGVDPKDICLVDDAGGIGGAWYWNRYPGVTCDIESYVYFPFLQETDYMPKHNFSYGFEIRAYLESLAARYGLDKNAMFRTKILSAEWDDVSKHWIVTMSKRIANDPPRTFKVRARFLSHFAGAHVHQKLPSIPGIASYKGDQFHIARWNYGITGGSQENPVLDKLRDKRVAIIGNGASGVQGVAEVAKYAKELYVVQRTPASVDLRDQRPTDPAEWAEITKEPNWGDIRCRNMADTFSGTLKPGEPQLVNDYTMGCTTYRAVFGGKDEGVTPEKLPEYARKLHEEDLPRMERIRKHVRETVKDPDTAARLTPWFSSWCKRPAFHDYFLEVFNQPNVHLVDDEKGITRVTPRGIVVKKTEYPVDVIIWATGYRGPFVGFMEERSNMQIIGRGGRHFDDKWRDNVATLHAAMTEGFPNLFLMGLLQGGMTLNHWSMVEVMVKHEAYIAQQAVQRSKGRDFSIEPTRDAEEEWSMEVLRLSVPSAVLAGCTPNYYSNEGQMDRMPMEAKMKAARAGRYGGGYGAFWDILEAWRKEGSMRGMRLDVV